MLTPSYSQLMEVIKKGEKLDNRVTSRYTVVLATAKRARQLTDGANPLTYAPTDRAVSIAVKEMSEEKLRIRVNESLIDCGQERIVRDPFRYRSALSKDDLNENLKQDYAPASYDLDSDDSDDFADDDFGKKKEADNIAAPEEEEDLTIYEDSDEEEEAAPREEAQSE